MTNDEAMHIKAKAFDLLMDLLEGNHRKVHSYERWVDMPRFSFDESTTNATIRSEKVHVYEWKILMRNRTDLKNAVMNDAAVELRKASPTLQRKPLTDEEIDDLAGAAFDDHAWRGTTIMSREIARAIEAAHGIGEKE